MRRALAALIACSLLACALLLLTPGPAFADGARDMEGAIDRYLAGAEEDDGARWVAGPGSAGYDQGYWIRGGDFALQINATLQARYERWLWDADEEPLDPLFPSGDLSGFAVPRATLKLAGTAPCSTSWYVELEFGQPGEDEIERRLGPAVAPLGPLGQSHAFETLREAWIQWSPSDLINIRMGKLATAATRQLMTPPELQQFVDLSLASAFVGSLMPGYTDRNRDHGLALHGRIGARNKWSYLLTLTNGDGGDGVRNVLDGRTSDDLALSARVNHAFKDPIGYEEGALRQTTCDTYGEVGAWVYYRDAGRDEALRFGVDVAWGYGGLSFSGAATWASDEDGAGADADFAAYLVQLGYHFPGSPWEIAARWSFVDVDNPVPALAPLPGQQQPLGNGAVSEIAFAVNYYLNGHGNKLGLDVALVSGHDVGSALLFDPYTGYQGNAGSTGTGDDTFGVLLRVQWQLAL